MGGRMKMRETVTLSAAAGLLLLLLLTVTLLTAWLVTCVRALIAG
jgi:hypothetical protein